MALESSDQGCAPHRPDIAAITASGRVEAVSVRFSGVNETSVILLDADGAGAGFRPVLQALGIDVFVGTNNPQCGERPFLLLSAGSFREPETRERLRNARQAIPDAQLCIVTGVMPADGGNPAASGRCQHNDILALLSAAGIGFLSGLGTGGKQQLHPERTQELSESLS
ncbi:MAG: hypothetical protein JJU19_15620 [Pararhodobacter sp.]|nr:hypothetical protein [Pararhodobacter sp.]